MTPTVHLLMTDTVHLTTAILKKRKFKWSWFQTLFISSWTLVKQMFLLYTLHGLLEQVGFFNNNNNNNNNNNTSSTYLRYLPPCTECQVVPAIRARIHYQSLTEMRPSFSPDRKVQLLQVQEQSLFARVYPKIQGQPYVWNLWNLKLEKPRFFARFCYLS